MNQIKIGKFIQEKRKEQKMTQSELAEKLGVTDRSVSKWENGKNMPDISLFNILCNELNITINDLLSGEKVDKNEYQEKLEKNIITIISNVNKKLSLVKKIIISFVSLLLILSLVFVIIINYKVTLKYNSNKMFIEEKNNSIVFTTKDLCTVYSGNINQYFLNLEEKKYGIVFLSSKCSYKEIIKKSFSNGNSYRYVQIVFPNNFSNNYKIYYTDINLNDIKKANKEQLNEYISKSVLIYENN